MCGEIFFLTYVYDSGSHNFALVISIGKILSSEGFWEFLDGVRAIS